MNINVKNVEFIKVHEVVPTSDANFTSIHYRELRERKVKITFGFGSEDIDGEGYLMLGEDKFYNIGTELETYISEQLTARNK